MRFIILPLATFFLLFGCQSSEIAESKTVDQSSIYVDYGVSYSERDEYATIKAEFRHGGFYGTSLVLSEPSKVTFNAHRMTVDSNFISGAFYHYQLNGKVRKNQPLNFVFTDYNGKKYKNEYKLRILKFKSLPNQVLKGDDLEIPVDHPKPGESMNERVSVWLRDDQTSSSCRANVNNGKLVISYQDLETHKGIVTVEITREYQEFAYSGFSKEGFCTISYEYEPFTVEIK